MVLDQYEIKYLSPSVNKFIFYKMETEKELNNKEKESNKVREAELQLREIIKSDKSKSFHHEGKRYWVGKKVKQELKNKLSEEKEGGFLPLIPILAGLASVAAISGGVATTVAKAKEACLLYTSPSPRD